MDPMHSKATKLRDSHGLLWENEANFAIHRVMGECEPLPSLARLIKKASSLCVWPFRGSTTGGF